jgi:hypothetical protein
MRDMGHIWDEMRRARRPPHMDMGTGMAGYMRAHG